MSTRRSTFHTYFPLRPGSRGLPSKPVVPSLQLHSCKPRSESPQAITLERLSLSPYTAGTRNVRIRLENKAPMTGEEKANLGKKQGRLLRHTAQESLYEDPKSHKLFAFVTVPSPCKVPSQPIGVSTRTRFPPRITAKALLLELQSLPCPTEPNLPIVLQRVYSRPPISQEKANISPFTVRGKGLELSFAREIAAYPELQSCRPATGRASEACK